MENTNKNQAEQLPQDAVIASASFKRIINF